jgi:NAD(P)H-hydrate epimerase
MELAGLAVAQVIYKVHPADRGNRILVLAGPGNNGGDGLVAARHLSMLGYDPFIYYPKKSKGELFERLETQLRKLNIPFIDDLDSGFASADHIVDALFGFSFKPPLRDPFPAVIDKLSQTKTPVTSVDIPSSWDVDNGPPNDNKFIPTYLVSLTAPKPAAHYFKGRQFVGGRFVSHEFASKYGFEVPNYPGLDQCVEAELNGAT